MDERTEKLPEEPISEQKAADRAQPLKKPQQAEAPRRRVGSLTLGVCLIAAGVFFLCYYFVPGFNVQLTLKIAPAVGLMLLGGEVLFFAARPGRWKYDFMSVFICLFLMAVCFCLTLLPKIWDEFDPEWQQRESRLGQEVVTELYTAFQNEAPSVRIKDMGGDLHLYNHRVDTLEEVAALSPGEDYLGLTVELFGPYSSAEEFAADCRTLTDEIVKGTVQADYVSFTWNPVNPAADTLESGSLMQTESYQLELNGTVQFDWTAEQMAEQTEVQSLLDEENEKD